MKTLNQLLTKRISKGKKLSFSTDDVKNLKIAFSKIGDVKDEGKSVTVIVDIQEDEYYNIKFEKVLTKDLDVQWYATVKHVEDSYNKKMKEKTDIFVSTDLSLLLNQLKSLK